MRLPKTGFDYLVVNVSPFTNHSDEVSKRTEAEYMEGIGVATKQERPQGASIIPDSRSYVSNGEERVLCPAKIFPSIQKFLEKTSSSVLRFR